MRLRAGLGTDDLSGGTMGHQGVMGGGKRSAATQPVFGFDAVMKLHKHLATVLHESKFVRAAFINGLPGFITLEADGELQTTALEIEDGKIAAIYVMRNPDKLRHLQESAQRH